MRRQRQLQHYLLHLSTNACDHAYHSCDNANPERLLAGPWQLALERLDKFLQHRLKGIRHISDIVKKDHDDTQIMLQHLGGSPM